YFPPHPPRSLNSGCPWIGKPRSRSAVFDLSAMALRWKQVFRPEPVGVFAVRACTGYWPIAPTNWACECFGAFA
ncbi:MAG TPA: hypothetical protein VN742_01855, partial [Candidatus Binataceae bacterium]|nr:hypothetical protein [Candidatus Binataceae bacterium]